MASHLLLQTFAVYAPHEKIYVIPNPHMRGVVLTMLIVLAVGSVGILSFGLYKLRTSATPGKTPIYGKIWRVARAQSYCFMACVFCTLPIMLYYGRVNYPSLLPLGGVMALYAAIAVLSSLTLYRESACDIPDRSHHKIRMLKGVRAIKYSLGAYCVGTGTLALALVQTILD